MHTKKPLKELFIENLGQVSGGYDGPGRFTTLAVGEEGHEPMFGPYPPPNYRLEPPRFFFGPAKF